MNESTKISNNLMAVFLDIENFCGYCDQISVPVDLQSIFSQLNIHARTIVRRSFGDIFSLPQQFQKFKIRKMLIQNQFSHEDVPHLSSCKNSSDIRLTVDAIALAYLRPDITHFTIISNDRDFVPLFNHLRSMGKFVTGCGPSRALVNKDYQNACDDFIFHDDIVTPILNESNKILSDGEMLLKVIAAFQYEGKQSKAPVVASRLKLMFPNFELKENETFKMFCLNQEKEGNIFIKNPDDSTFLILPATVKNENEDEICELTGVEHLKHSAISDHNPIITSDDPNLLEAYRQWIVKKIKMIMPTITDRERIYQVMQKILDQRQDQHEPLPLKMLAEQTGMLLPGLQNVAFRIYYGLYRSRALQCTQTDDSFNPGVIKSNVAVDRLDHYFCMNMLDTFRKDPMGLAFNPEVWDKLVNQV